MSALDLFDVGRIVSLDIEGDGGRQSLPIEIGVCEAHPDAGALREWRIRPTRPIDPFATKVHGLRNRDLADVPLVEDVAHEVLDALDGAIVVGHGVRDDLRCLQRAIPNLPRYEALDTQRMSRQLLLGLPGYSLSVVAEALGVRVEKAGRGRHSAGYDAKLGVEAFLRLCMLPGAEAYLKGAGLRPRRHVPTP